MMNEIIAKFKKGDYQPLGADGGVLKYILCDIKQGQARASITLDSEISKIRKIWALELNGKEIFDFTNEYYQVRKAL